MASSGVPDLFKKRESEAYYFPDLAMQMRLQARNGGGKLTCLYFGRDSSDSGQ
jgi:hypothetical protein